jgi:hypothetical protein
MNRGDFNYNRRSWLEDDDPNEHKFGNRNQQPRSAGDQANDEEALRSLQERIARSENESLESTHRSLRLLNETHDLGAHTAQELVRQGEKLERVEATMDGVDQTLTSTQKNLNQIKSIFGAWTNRFFRY